MKTIREHPEKFELHNSGLSAFSLRGGWDKDESEHLNTHAFHQIVMVDKGMLMLEDLNVKQPLYQNMAAFIPVNVPHLVKAVNRQGVQFESLYLSPDLFSSRIERIQIFEISELEASLLRELNTENLTELNSGIMGQCLELFINLLYRDIEQSAELIRLPRPTLERNEAVVTFIQENYMNAVRLEDFRAAVPLSIRQITRNFQAEMKINVMEYLRLYRLLQASILLHEKKRKIIDIAYDCGYNGMSSFHSDFKQYFGLSPGGFRKFLSD